MISKGLTITKDRIVRDLRKIGIKDGDHICVHSSLKSIGYVTGGPETLIDALLEVVGPNGTILMPAFTRLFPLRTLISNKVDYIFDYRSTPTWIGLVPETLRNRKNSIRSHHPTNSVVAIGKYSKYLTDGHDENSRAFIPFSRLTKINGKILGIGVGYTCLTLGHEAQSQIGLFDVVPLKGGVKFRDDDGNVKLFIRKDIAGCEFPNLLYIFRKMGLATYGNIGLAKSILLPAKKLLEVLINILNDNPSLNLCSRVSCLWCRELERRLNIFDGIENPKYFQRYILIRRIISIINWLRLRESRIIAPLRFLDRFVDITQKVFD